MQIEQQSIDPKVPAFIQWFDEQYRHGQERARLSSQMGIEAANALRECGKLLEAARADLPHGAYQLVLEGLEIARNREKTTQLLLTLARRNPEPFTDAAHVQREFDDILRAAGELEFPQGHGKQRLHDVNLMEWVAKSVTGWRSELKKKVGEDPIEGWRPHEAQQLVTTMRPMIDDVNEIFRKAEMRSREAA